MTTSNNPFWLEVKKEYVKDNFESLVEYLKNCSLDSEKFQNDKNELSDFNRTFQALQEATIESLSVLTTGKVLGQTSKSSWEEISDDIRMVATYLLTCKIKGTSDYKILAQFADYFVLAGFATTNELLMKLRKVVIGCAIEAGIEAYGFSWKNVLEWKDIMTPETFCNHLGNTRFLDSSITGYYERKGILVCKDNSLTILPLNKQQYIENLKLNKLSSQFVQEESLLTIDVMKKDKRVVSSFEDVEQNCTSIVLQQSDVKPSPKVNLKNYKEGDELIAKVIGYYEYGLVVESIDISYNKISGRVFFDTKLKKYSIDSGDLKRFVKIGDSVTVKLQNKQNLPFALTDCVFCEYYKSVVDNSGSIIDAIYKGSYSVGYQWRTIEGVIVNVYGTNVDESIRQAIAEGTPIKVQIRETKKDKSGNLVVNGDYYDEPSEISKEDFMEQAKKNLLEGFVEYSHDDMPMENEDKDSMILFDVNFVSRLSHIYYSLSQHCVSARNRYVHLMAAYMLSIMADNNEGDFIKFEMDYLSKLVRFAQGDTPKLLSINPDEELLKHDVVKSHIDVLEQLRKYSTEGRGFSTIQMSQMTEDERSSVLKRLVVASNILIGEASWSEINRIKKSIAKFLSVEEEYKNILPDLTYYGEESDTLEFKTSLVYSPNSKLPEPNKQIWNILKTICGFMNTLSGGELLLGVKDDGYSQGLDDDIMYLYENKKIESANIDRYRDYLKRKVDHAFIDDSGLSKGQNITSGRIHYLIEKNKEEHTILRIQVRPYEYGNVLFDSSLERPEEIGQCYYRTSGATVPMDKELKRKAYERKMNASYDGNLQIFVLLQQACNEKKRAKLVNYTSHSEVRDRYVEPFKALPEHDAFLFYDIDKKEIREYKLSRIESVKLLEEKWLYENKHKPNIRIDIFGFIESSLLKPYEVVLKLKPLAYNLLKEEFKKAEKYISDNEDVSDNEEYPKVLKTIVCANEGVGRFYIGLANSIKIVSGDKLREYVHEYKEKYLTI